MYIEMGGLKMRTTVEITPEQRARLLELAARQGRKGFSHLVRQALELYLARQQQIEDRKKMVLDQQQRLAVRDRVDGKATLEIDKALRERLEQLAAETGQTVTELVQDLLRHGSQGKPGSRNQFRLEWEPVSGSLCPGVDLADRDALIERMEGRS
jgi:predicted transcriptional regulator